MPDHRIVTAADDPAFGDFSERLAVEVWPAFMLQDPVASRYWRYLFEYWPQYQFALLQDEELVAVGNSLPAPWTAEAAALPDEGWDWILPHAVETHNAGAAPTAQFALQVMVPLKHRGQGWSQKAVAAMADIGRAHSLGHLYAPVRPSGKSQYPLIDMDQYVTWQDERGRPFDPWIRVHLRLGARFVKVCPRSMTITGTLAQWHEWTGLPFPGSGQYTVPGALAPVTADAKADHATYIEPNVWLEHTL